MSQLFSTQLYQIPKDRFASIRIVALDLDGTLQTTNHCITSRTIHSIKQLSNFGVNVILATGNTYFAGEYVRKQLGIASPSVHVQGLQVYDSAGKIISVSFLNPSLATEALNIIQERQIDVIAYSDNRIIATKRNEWTSSVEKFGEPTIQIVENLVVHRIHKVLAIASVQKITILRAHLAKIFDGRATVVQSNLGNMVEVLPIGASKGAGVRMVVNHLGSHSRHLLAMGDGENDLEMIKLASIGVAMGNAEQILKESADLIAPTNDEEGVAVMLEHLIEVLSSLSD